MGAKYQIIEAKWLINQPISRYEATPSLKTLDFEENTEFSFCNISADLNNPSMFF